MGQLKGKDALVYTAGIIDGEGTISIIRHKNNTRRGYSLQLVVGVASTNEWLCQWLKMQYAGTVTADHVKGNRKPAWHWMLSSYKARDLLIAILPYLQLKYPHAELALKFQNSRRRHKKTEVELAVDEANRILLGKWNKRGLK